MSTLRQAPTPDMFRLTAFSQVMENYSDEERPHWKPKFGSDYLIAELTLAEVQCGREVLQAKVDAVKHAIDEDGPMCREWIVSWALFAPGDLTESEKLELEFEGSISMDPFRVAKILERAQKSGS